MTNQSSPRRLIPVTAKLSAAEASAFEELLVALGTTDNPASVSYALRHALMVACQAANVEWPTVLS